MHWKERSAAASRRARAAVSGALARLGASRRLKAGIAGALAFALVAFAASKSLARIRGGEVGVVVNNLTGGIRVEDRAGYRLLVPWIESFFRLDRRVQTLLMSEGGGGGFRGADAVKVKTIDGSNVSLDLQATYRLLPERAADVLRNAGRGAAFGELWIRSSVRAMAWREFGKLTTEQMYDAALRDERARSTVRELNRQLADQGVEIIAVVPHEFRFYREYEEIIKAKKLADQGVEEQRSQAKLASEEQHKQIAAAEFAAQHKIAEAEGEARRTRAEADGYVQRVQLEAEAAVFEAEKRAAGIEAVGLAEAQGLGESAAALEGVGGVHLVALEYARKLGEIRFTGVPVMQEANMSQFRIQHGPDGAAAGSADASGLHSEPLPPRSSR